MKLHGQCCMRLVAPEFLHHQSLLVSAHCLVMREAGDKGAHSMSHGAKDCRIALEQNEL